MPSFRDGPALSLVEGAYHYCRWLTHQAHSHFSLGLKILPPRKRRAMEAVYAFCRAVDDVVDREETEDRGQKTEDRRQRLKDRKKQELELWRRELQRVAQGSGVHPIAVALQEVIWAYEIPIAHFEAILSGVEMDLTKKRYANFSELQGYCEKVASAVGLISIRIFGCEHPAAQRYAHDLGVALQLVNILRDIRSDHNRGRVYLPQEELRQFHLSEESIANGAVSSPDLRAFMAFQAKRAREFFKQADEVLQESGEKRKLLPARIMGKVYERLLTRIEEANYDVFAQRLSVPRGEQVRAALQCLIR